MLVVSDGNGVDAKFPKWPTILKILTSKTNCIINRSVIGASNELIFMQIAEAIEQDHIDFAIIQWTNPTRLDVVVNEFWEGQAAIDDVYHFNIVNNNSKQWWVSSESTNPHVREYHTKYINHWQAHQRSQSYMLAAAELLKSKNIKFIFSLCYKFNFYDPFVGILNSYPWAWHTPNLGINDFRTVSRFAKFDIPEYSQPQPLIALDWIDQVLRPHCGFVDYSRKTLYNIENSLLKKCSE